MHHIHHTNAIILGSRNKGEANRSFVLLTRELGLIHAVAQGVRYQKSKLRYALQDFSHAKIDLVRGRETWRITSASAVNSFSNVRKTSFGVKLQGNIAKLLRRLIQGEEAVHASLYDDVLAVFNYLDRDDVDARVFETAELCLVLRILKHLGYLSDGERFKDYVGDSFSLDAIDYSKFEKKTIIFEINRALKESHL
jgi:DNA repair protein RecO